MCKDWNTPNDFLPLQNSSENYAGSRRYEYGDKIKDKRSNSNENYAGARRYKCGNPRHTQRQ